MVSLTWGRETCGKFLLFFLKRGKATKGSKIKIVPRPRRVGL
jgi:hypothetical protein